MNGQKIKFQVKGRPPRKTNEQSCWSKRGTEWELIYNLREEAFKAKTAAKIDDPIKGKVKLTISIFAKNLTKEDEHEHIGDLDTFVAGIFEAIQIAHKNPTLEIDEKLKNNSDFGSGIPFLIEDDSYIVEIIARKIKNEDDDNPFYEIEIESVE